MTDPVTTTDVFLDAVTPKGNRYIGFTNGNVNHAGRPIINCSPFTEARDGVYKASRKTDEDVYFALASFKEARILDVAKGYMKSYRHQENVDKLKSIWLDVDFKSYSTPEDCVEDIRKFMSDFPKPTFIVNSGGGVHLYWCFEEELTPTQWTPLAQGLAALAKQRGLRADFGVTIDSARVLRLPGSRNQKYDAKPECRITGMGSFANIDRMEELLRPHAAGQARTQAPITIDANVVNMFDPAANSDLSSGYEPNKTSDFTIIASQCPTVASAVERGGKGDTYMLWKDLLHLAAFCDDPVEAAISVSNGDERYDEDVMRNYLDGSIETKTNNRRGPTSCVKFSASSDKCATCKHLGRIKSPWILGVTKEEEENQEPSYAMQGSTFTTAWEKDDNDVMVAVRKQICAVELKNFRLVSTTDPEDPFQICLDASLGKTHTTIRLLTKELTDLKTFRTKMANNSVALPSGQVKGVSDLIMAWIDHLKRVSASEGSQSFGWNATKTSFVIGNRRITADSIEEVVGSQFVNASEFDPKGKPEVWSELAQLLADDDDPAFSYLLCAGFAGPLMDLFGIRCSVSISAFSQNSGAGKTTVLKTIQAAFGDPMNTFSLNTTENFILERMGAMSGMPGLWDEIRGNDKAEMVTNILFSLSEGKTKGRLNQNASMRTQHKLRTMLLCCANNPLSDYVNHKIQLSNAGMARLIEFEMQAGREHSYKVTSAVSALDENYGHAFPIYIQTLIQNMDALAKAEKTIDTLLEKEREWKNEERFWQWGTIKIMLAAQLLNKSGLLKIDMAKLKKFALQVVETQRTEMDSNEVASDDVVSSLFRHFAGRVLITNKYKGVAGRGAVEPIRSPWHASPAMHVSAQSRMIRINVSDLRDYTEESGISLKNLTHTLERRYGAIRVRRSLGAGTNHSVGITTVLEFKLDAAVAEGIISFDEPKESDSPSTSSLPATLDSSTGAPL